MSAAFETIRIPKQLYVRLRRRADHEKVEPVNLIERLLTQALLEEQLDTIAQTELIAPIYKLHEYAEDLGIADLAENIDHYLYGHDSFSFVVME